MHATESLPQTPQLQLAAETITVKIRWFGLCVGYVVVNFLGRDTNQPVLNAILFLGAIYALIDTWWSVKGKVFLSDGPLIISLMEAIFIGLLCHFDTGLESPFRFYYFLSLLLCALRYSSLITYSTFSLHAISYIMLYFTHPESVGNHENLTSLFLMLVWMGWVTWAGTSLAGLMKSASRQLTKLNEELQENQSLLEDRIQERTQQLQESQALLVQQEKQAAFGLLAAGIAHEVGNPLAAISSLVQMMNRRQTDEYMRERLGLIDDQLRRIQRTLRELVDFSRPANSEESLCDLHHMLDEALNIAKYYKGKKGKQIITSYADDIPRFKAIRDQLVQVFLNLILNAMDATQEGGSIEIQTLAEPSQLKIFIRDDGCGISTEDQLRLFKPYFTTKKQGTGLGLFVCRNLLQQSGAGTITLEESSPAGTTFLVSLERHSEYHLPVEDSHQPDAKTSANVAPQDSTKSRV